MWFILALGSSISFCFVSVCDKRLLSFHLNGVPPLCLWCGVSGMLYGSVTLAAAGVPAGTAWQVAVAPICSGLLMGSGVVLLFRGMRIMEASRAVAIAQIAPIFVAFLAMVFLGERISLVQWGAIGLVVSGAMLISMRLFQITPHDRLRARASVNPSVGIGDRLAGLTGATSLGPPLLMLSALCSGASFVTTKAALNAELPALTAFAMQQTVSGCVFLIAGWSGRQRLLEAVRQPRVLGMLVFGESLMPAVSILLSVYAYSLGDASLVVGVLATRPLFVFIASTTLSRVRWRLLDETLTPKTLVVKSISILLIVGGVGALSLG